MTETRAKPKTFRRRVMSEVWVSGSYNRVTLSCGHILYVHAFERYADCKTLSCETCRAEAESELEPEDRSQPGTCLSCHVRSDDLRFHRCHERVQTLSVDDDRNPVAGVPDFSG